MPRVQDVIAFFEDFAPAKLAESWDNVGLLWGDADAELTGILACLTLTPDVAAEAISGGANLVVTHHPILFRPVQRLTTATPEGRMLLALAAARASVYSPHTAFDSAARGINQQLAEHLGLRDIRPLREVAVGEPATGTGRCGSLASGTDLRSLLDEVRRRLGVKKLQYVGDLDRAIDKVGIACGSAAEMLRDAHAEGCDVLVTGEARFHACLEAEQLGVAMVLLGHYASERPGVEQLADVLASAFEGVTVWASRAESDPVRWA